MIQKGDMAFSVIIKAEAHKDVLNAFFYYEEQQQGLGEKFLKSLDERYSDLLIHPYNYSFINEDPLKVLRDVRLKKFPYVIVFEIADDIVIVYAVHNLKRHSGQKLRSTAK